MEALFNEHQYLLFEVFQHLPAGDVRSFAQVSRSFHQLASCRSLWEVLYRRDRAAICYLDGTSNYLLLDEGQEHSCGVRHLSEVGLRFQSWCQCCGKTSEDDSEEDSFDEEGKQAHYQACMSAEAAILRGLPDSVRKIDHVDIDYRLLYRYGVEWDGSLSEFFDHLRDRKSAAEAPDECSHVCVLLLPGVYHLDKPLFIEDEVTIFGLSTQVHVPSLAPPVASSKRSCRSMSGCDFARKGVAVLRSESTTVIASVGTTQVWNCLMLQEQESGAFAVQCVRNKLYLQSCAVISRGFSNLACENSLMWAVKCTIAGGKQVGLVAYRGARVHIVASRLDGNAQGGMVISCGSQARVSDSMICNNGNDGIRVEKRSALALIDCRVLDHCNDSLMIGTGSHVAIRNCEMGAIDNVGGSTLSIFNSFLHCARVGLRLASAKGRTLVAKTRILGCITSIDVDQDKFSLSHCQVGHVLVRSNAKHCQFTRNKIETLELGLGAQVDCLSNEFANPVRARVYDEPDALEEAQQQLDFIASTNKVPSTEKILFRRPRCPSVPAEIETALEKNVCTSTFTGVCAFLQQMFHCVNCSLFESRGVCAVCAKTCHKGHEIIVAPEPVEFACQCNVYSKCIK